MRNNLVLVIIILLNFGCATAGKLNKISLGMTKAEVIDVMGNPTSTSAKNGVEYMHYALYETNTAAQNGAPSPYFVRIIDGKVEAYGRHGEFAKPKKIEIDQKITTVKEQ